MWCGQGLGVCLKGLRVDWALLEMRRGVSTRITFEELVRENRAQTSGLLDSAECFVPVLHLNQ